MSITILDGGMSRELMRLNAPFKQPEWSALSLYEKPSAVQQVHEEFIKAGAQIITTNSYAVVPFHIGEQRFHADGKMLSDLAGRLAKSAVKNSGVLTTKIAGSLPPMFGSYRADYVPGILLFLYSNRQFHGKVKLTGGEKILLIIILAIFAYAVFVLPKLLNS